MSRDIELQDLLARLDDEAMDDGYDESSGDYEDVDDGRGHGMSYGMYTDDYSRYEFPRSGNAVKRAHEKTHETESDEFRSKTARRCGP